MQAGYVRSYGTPQSDLPRIFEYFMKKNHPLTIKKKKLELERLLSSSNRDSYLNKVKQYV
jgi:hypothetical protein